jgi:hypothetical protein
MRLLLSEDSILSQRETSHEPLMNAVDRERGRSCQMKFPLRHVDIAAGWARNHLRNTELLLLQPTPLPTLRRSTGRRSCGRRRLGTATPAVAWVEHLEETDHPNAVKYTVFGVRNSDWASTHHRVPK